MTKKKNKRKLLVKVVSILLIFVFSISTIAWSFPSLGEIKVTQGETLQVPSIFHPITKITGEKYETQIRIEIAIILAMIIKNKDAVYPILNAELNKWYGNPLNEKTKKALRVISNPKETSEGTELKVEIEFGNKEEEQFKILLKRKSVEDIQKGENNIRIIFLQKERHTKKSKNEKNEAGKTKNNIDIERLYKKEALLEKWHTKNVVQICTWIAEQVGIKEEDKELVIKAAIIHDIGKRSSSLKAHFCSPEEIDKNKRTKEINGHMQKSVEIAQEKGIPLNEVERILVLNHHTPASILELENVKNKSETEKIRILTLAYILTLSDAIDAYYITGKHRPYRWLALTEEKTNGRILGFLIEHLEKTGFMFPEEMPAIAKRFLKTNMFKQMKEASRKKPYFWSAIAEWEKLGKYEEYMEIVFQRIKQTGKSKKIEAFIQWIRETADKGEEYMDKEDINAVLKKISEVFSEQKKTRMKKGQDREKKVSVLNLDEIFDKEKRRMPKRKNISNLQNIKQFAKTELLEKDMKVDIVIDTALLQKEEESLDADIKTLAQLIISYRDMKNVNFVIEKREDLLDRSDVTEEIAAEITNSSKAEDILEMVKKEIKKSAIYFNIVSGSEKELINRINLERRAPDKKPIEINICSEKILEWMQDKNIPLKKNQYPVAVKNIKGKGIGNDFETAFSLGFIKAVLVQAKRTDIETGDREKKAFKETKRKVEGKLKKLYEEIFPGRIKGEANIDKIMDGMVYSEGKYSGSMVRLGLALDLVLPTVTRIAVDSIVDIYNNIQIPVYSV
ncbi:MAG: HD domain-containing protein [Candidatus Omnitrophica bacterium]|nr:HD domain-containing protein [Candidatus Omnitrophota bacterium]